VLYLTANQRVRLGNIVALLSWGRSFIKAPHATELLTLCNGCDSKMAHRQLGLGWFGFTATNKIDYESSK